jgi:hypothetical protein
VGFVVDKVALGQVFSEYFGFPCQFSFHQYSTITLIYHLGLYNRPEVAVVPGDVSPTPLMKKKDSFVVWKWDKGGRDGNRLTYCV